MTDPAPADPTATAPTSPRGRPSKVVERDLAVARTLAEEERSLHAVMAALDLEWRITYNSVCRLRDQGLAELNRNGTRTPTWRLTERGHEWLGTAPPEAQPTEDPAPEPEAEAVPEPPVVEVPTPVEPEVVQAPTVVVEQAPQPVPIEPPVPEPTSVGVAPSPGPTEPIWPV